jgi:hypothetical protein
MYTAIEKNIERRIVILCKMMYCNSFTLGEQFQRLMFNGISQCHYWLVQLEREPSDLQNAMIPKKLIRMFDYATSNNNTYNPNT